ncbi:MAG: hypothetical protein IKN31_06015 [Bacteroidales bacterium]|nr:hypothetical protein [Bacteroidales bacterium]
MQSNKSNNSKIARNTLFLYIRMVFVLIVGLYTSRVVLNVLGASDYGTFNVIAGFVSLFSFLNATFTASIQRFYNFEGGRNGEDGYSSVFSVGFRVHAVLAVVVFVLLESFGLWYVNNVMVLPEGRLFAANILFQCSVLSMLLVIMQVPFSGAIISKERMDYYAVVSIIDVVLKLVLVCSLPYLPFDKLIAYAVIQLLVNVVSFLLYFVYVRIKFSYLRLAKRVDKFLLKSMLSFSGWTLVGSFAFLFKGQGVNLLLNAFFGTIVNAARGVAYQINTAVMGFSSNIAMSFRPQMVSSYAEGDTNRAFNLFKAQSKICYTITLMLMVPVIFEMDYLLKLWLGNAVPQYSNIFATLVLIDALICTLNAPVTQIVSAVGEIKSYQIYSALVNILLIPVCWLFLKKGYDAWIVFLLTIVFSILCQVACLLVMHKVFPFSYKEYVSKVVLPCVVMSVVVPIIPYLLTVYMTDSFWRLIIICISSLITTSGILYALFLNGEEKALVSNYVHKILRK